MAKAYVSFHPIALRYPLGSSENAPPVYSAVLDFTSGQAVTGSAMTSELADLSTLKDCIEFSTSISVDTAGYIAIGTVPDCTLETATEASSARMYLAAGTSIDLFLPLGAKVAAKAVS
jgi:hypothetical protein